LPPPSGTGPFFLPLVSSSLLSPHLSDCRIPFSVIPLRDTPVVTMMSTPIALFPLPGNPLRPTPRLSFFGSLGTESLSLLPPRQCPHPPPCRGRPHTTARHAPDRALRQGHPPVRKPCPLRAGQHMHSLWLIDKDFFFFLRLPTSTLFFFVPGQKKEEKKPTVNFFLIPMPLFSSRLTPLTHCGAAPLCHINFFFFRTFLKPLRLSQTVRSPTVSLAGPRVAFGWTYPLSMSPFISWLH